MTIHKEKQKKVLKDLPDNKVTSLFFLKKNNFLLLFLFPIFYFLFQLHNQKFTDLSIFKPFHIIVDTI